MTQFLIEEAVMAAQAIATAREQEREMAAVERQQNLEAMARRAVGR